MKITHKTYDEDQAKMILQAMADQKPIMVDVRLAGGFTKEVEVMAISARQEFEKYVEMPGPTDSPRRIATNVRRACTFELYIAEFDAIGVDL